MIDVNNILLPTDFSDCAAAALEYACDLAQRYDAKLSMLHVIHDPTLEVPDFGMGLAFPGYVENLPDRRKKVVEAANDALKNLSDACPQHSTAIEYHIKFGQPFKEVLKLAEEDSVDLIVMGTHGRAGLSHILLGSVAERVIQKANCPVMTVGNHVGH